MASVPPNPDTRELPPGWIQQYNWEYGRWYDLAVATTKREPLNYLRFYVNTREQPPRSMRLRPWIPPTIQFSSTQLWSARKLQQRASRRLHGRGISRFLSAREQG
ncbi:hypothetical protein M404DRAFT_630614 [Pisolithus tinctorius Marx 270]|uniref:WW domain-containing protein n=1 Tax=Pisolithus tinctorius Marx 270 TaxID=870435 RepID=A0A0C3J1Q9_PISTI|nr:hypothetical protein M404DRAFT_630614 [Pisolithus tinctorius Marx 270]